MTVLDELASAAKQVVEVAGDGVVRIGRGPGRGAGFVVAEGLVVTNAHNLRGREVTVTFAGERSLVGEWRGVDVDGDLAVVAVDTGDAPAIDWEPDEARRGLGAPVFTLARPSGGALRVTFGLVSAAARGFRSPRGRAISDGLEHTAPLGRGSSGGPVLSADGRLIGISTHRLADGFYLALPATAERKARIDALAEGRSPSRRHLGVALSPPVATSRLRAAVGLPERDGVLIRAVEEGSPAALAGLRRGDLVVTAAGRPVASPDDLLAAIDDVDTGDVLALRVVRGAGELDLAVSFAAPDASDAPAEG
jgi:serine protease Do